MYVDQEFIGERNILCDVMQKGKIFHRPIRTAAHFGFSEKNIGLCVPNLPLPQKKHTPIIDSSNPARRMYRRQ